jgi:acyl-CoA thioesterase FadM
MAKITLELPETFAFRAEIQVMIQHINRANHLANEHIVAFLNEARTQYCHSIDYASFGISADQFINADLVVLYQSEAHYGDRLCIDVAAQDFSKYGCDFIYKISQKSSGKSVAIAKTAMLHFDYEQKCLSAVPSNFRDLFKID